MSPRVLVALLLLAFVPSPAADQRPSPPAPDLAGRYAGKWTASEGSATGSFEVTFRRDDKAAWVADASFTFEGAKVPTVTRSIAVEAARVVLVLDWKIQDVPGESRITGEFSGDGLSGDYETKTNEGRTSGTWSLKRVPPADRS